MQMKTVLNLKNMKFNTFSQMNTKNKKQRQIQVSFN